MTAQDYSHSLLQRITGHVRTSTNQTLTLDNIHTLVAKPSDKLPMTDISNNTLTGRAAITNKTLRKQSGAGLECANVVFKSEIDDVQTPGESTMLFETPSTDGSKFNMTLNETVSNLDVAFMNKSYVSDCDRSVSEINRDIAILHGSEMAMSTVPSAGTESVMITVTKMATPRDVTGKITALDYIGSYNNNLQYCVLCD